MGLTGSLGSNCRLRAWLSPRIRLKGDTVVGGTYGDRTYPTVYRTSMSPAFELGHKCTYGYW